MGGRLLEWLDTHLVHHRWEWSRLNVLRPLLARLICDRWEALVLASQPDWSEAMAGELGPPSVD